MVRDEADSSNASGLQPTAVSQVLKVIQDEDEGLATSSAKFALSPLKLLAASGLSTRELAFRMAYSVYRKKGYVPDRSDGLLVAQYDARPDTLVALALNGNQVAGTVTLVFDSNEGLPCDEIFSSELCALRHQGRCLVEVTRLAIDPAFANSKDLLALLCNIPFAYSSRIRGYTDLVVEVNPRHVPFYQRLMKFQAIGNAKPCPRVNGAPAVLLRTNLEDYLECKHRSKKSKCTKSERSLFPHFLSEQEEISLMDQLASQQRAMTISEMQFFGLNRLDPVHWQGRRTSFAS